jgi:hypothetical protein
MIFSYVIFTAVTVEIIQVVKCKAYDIKLCYGHGCKSWSYTSCIDSDLWYSVT